MNRPRPPIEPFLRPAAPRGSRGFSLLEVLAAFVILALVGTALFRLFGGALVNASAAGDWSRAVLVAESRLAEAATADPLRETTDRGSVDDGRITWETRVLAYTPPDVPPDVERVSQNMATRLFRVEVDVRFRGDNGAERSLTLATVQLARKELQ
jgi:general secretion pathway protein I